MQNLLHLLKKTSSRSAASFRSSSERAALDFLPHAARLLAVVSRFLSCLRPFPLFCAFFHLLSETDIHVFRHAQHSEILLKHERKDEDVRSVRIAALRSLAPLASSLPLPVWGRRGVSSQSMLRFAETVQRHTCMNGA